MPLGPIYAETRCRITELVRSLPPDRLAATLPTCPAWTSRDVVGHMTGLVADVQTGNLPGLGTPDWTQGQVDAYSDRTLDEVLDDWATLAAGLEADLEAVAGADGIRVVSDAYTHEQDIRGAVGRPGAREAAALPFVLDFQLTNLGRRVADAGLPALRVRAGDLDRVVGDGSPAGTLTVDSPWELQRSLMARRSRAQIAALAWDGADPARYLPVFFRFDPPEHDIVE